MPPPSRLISVFVELEKFVGMKLVTPVILEYSVNYYKKIVNYYAFETHTLPIISDVCVLNSLSSSGFFFCQTYFLEIYSSCMENVAKSTATMASYTIMKGESFSNSRTAIFLHTFAVNTHRYIATLSTATI